MAKYPLADGKAWSMDWVAAMMQNAGLACQTAINFGI